ncbi:MAG TPA: DNA-protecting protein DprA, partial [Burkholderiaceae bacterium]|nr:DNA-protecting protein DprA [Burkholderiaceae bacterium]
MERDELGAWLRLLLTPGVGNATARQLLAALGGPHQVFEQPPAVLASLVGPRLTDALLTPPPDCASQLNTTWAWLQA